MSLAQMSSASVQVLCLFFIFSICCVCPMFSLQPPEIKVFSRSNIINTSNPFNMTIISEPLGGFVGFRCIADYPIDWHYYYGSSSGNNKVHEFISSETFRVDGNQSTPYIFWNQIKIRPSEQTSGNYECFNIQQPNISTFIYAVFQGSESGSGDGVISKENQIEVKYSLNNDSSVVLPFPSLNPFAKTSLMRKQSKVNLNYTYDPRIGFNLNLPAQGIYIAHIDRKWISFNLTKTPLLRIDPPKEFVVFDPTNDNDDSTQLICTSSEEIFLHTSDFSTDSPKIECGPYHGTEYRCRLNSTFLRDSFGNVSCFATPWKLLHTWRFIQKGSLQLTTTKEGVIQCQSKSRIPTNLISLECANPTECELRKYCLTTMASCESLVVKSKSPEALEAEAFWNETTMTMSKFILHRLNVRTLQYHESHNSGLLRCWNAYGEITQMYFKGLPPGNENEPRIYTNWENALDLHREDLILLNYDGNLDEKIYEGQQIHLTCIMNPFVFSNLFSPKLYYKLNGNEKNILSFPVENITGILQEHKREAFIWRISLKADPKDMTQIICSGPIWNSTIWLNASYDLYISESIPPKFVEAKTDVEFFPQDGGSSSYVLYCNASGKPIPRITWYDPYGNEIRFNDDDVIREYLDFHKHDETFNGDYTCEAKNHGGKDVKTFSVIFITSSNRNATFHYFLVIILPIIILLLLGVVTFLWIRLKIRNRKYRSLTSEEIAEFEIGRTQGDINFDADLLEIANNLPFNKDLWEISRDMLQFYESPSSTLGCGAFGCVYRGTYGSNTTVAIKTVKPQVEILFFKALLSEVKLLCYIGQHPNIVQFIGACTEKIRERRIFIVLEFCQNGSLLNFLEKSQNNFKNLVVDDEIVVEGISSLKSPSYANDSLGLTPSTLDLINFSIQIISGLEHLSQKKVIHGDLAARNVLLDENLVAKLSDFGLSRQLYNADDYVKQTREPLPWRYMAIESLQRFNFSHQSDIWGLGITLWEIFSLGCVPYPGYTYTQEFIQLVENGMRLSQPKFATSSLYQNVMLECWKTEPDERISLGSAKDIFNSMCRKSTSSNYYYPTKC